MINLNRLNIFHFSFLDCTKYYRHLVCIEMRGSLPMAEK
jgi:hypothetical protein